MQKSERFKKQIIAEETDHQTGKERLIVRDQKDYSQAMEIRGIAATLLHKINSEFMLILDH